MRRKPYPTELDAVLAFGRAALPLTERDGFERCAAVTRRKNGYRLGRICRGFHNNVILQAIWLALCSLFLGRTAFVHTHPNCSCHAGECFSGRRNAKGRILCPGDISVPGLGRIYCIYLVAPSGTVSVWDGKNEPKILARLADDAGKPLCAHIRYGSRAKGLLPRRIKT